MQHLNHYNMKKLILSIALASVSIIGLAQVPKIGIQGGVNFANVSISSGSFSASPGTLTTYQVGAFADFKAGAISIQPGVYYAGKGFKVEDAGDAVQLKLHYIQVPVNFVYHIPAVIGSVYLGAGPFVGFGTSGKAKTTTGGNSVEEKITFGDGVEDIKRTEFGAQGIAGFQFKTSLMLGFHYDLGLSDISNDTSEGSIKNRVWGLSVGFSF